MIPLRDVGLKSAPRAKGVRGTVDNPGRETGRIRDGALATAHGPGTVRSSRIEQFKAKSAVGQSGGQWLRGLR